MSKGSVIRSFKSPQDAVREARWPLWFPWQSQQRLVSLPTLVSLCGLPLWGLFSRGCFQSSGPPQSFSCSEKLPMRMANDPRLQTYARAAWRSIGNATIRSAGTARFRGGGYWAKGAVCQTEKGTVASFGGQKPANRPCLKRASKSAVWFPCTLQANKLARFSGNIRQRASGCVSIYGVCSIGRGVRCLLKIQDHFGQLPTVFLHACFVEERFAANMAFSPVICTEYENAFTVSSSMFLYRLSTNFPYTQFLSPFPRSFPTLLHRLPPCFFRVPMR